MLPLRLSPALLLLPLVGCLDEPDRTETFRFTETVESVMAKTGSGDIDIRRDADASEVYVEAVVYGSATRVNTRVAEGELRLTHECPKAAGQCGVDWVVVLPSSILAGDLDLDTGSGDVRVEHVVGRHMLAESGSGDVSFNHVEALELPLNSGSGDVYARLGNAPERLQMATGSGDISLHLPRGSYDLDLDTGSGDVSTDSISDDSDAAQQVELTTGSGDITVRGR